MKTENLGEDQGVCWRPVGERRGREAEPSQKWRQLRNSPSLGRRSLASQLPFLG